MWGLLSGLYGGQLSTLIDFFSSAMFSFDLCGYDTPVQYLALSTMPLITHINIIQNFSYVMVNLISGKTIYLTEKNDDYFLIQNWTKISKLFKLQIHRKQNTYN